MATVKLRIIPDISGIKVWVDGEEIVPVVMENANVVHTTVDIVEIEFEAEVTIPSQYTEVKAKP